MSNIETKSSVAGQHHAQIIRRNVAAAAGFVKNHAAAGLEMRNELLRHWHLLSGLRIAASARWVVVDRKTAKSTNLDSPASL